MIIEYKQAAMEDAGLLVDIYLRSVLRYGIYVQRHAFVDQ